MEIQNVELDRRKRARGGAHKSEFSANMSHELRTRSMG